MRGRPVVPQERIERVTELWQAGGTYGEIGRALGLTRSAVAGICYRAGLNRADEEMLAQATNAAPPIA